MSEVLIFIEPLWLRVCVWLVEEHRRNVSPYCSSRLTLKGHERVENGGEIGIPASSLMLQTLIAHLNLSSRVLSHYRKANILLSQTWKKMSFIHPLDSWHVTFKLRTLTPLQTRKSYFFYMFNTCHLSINTKVGILHTPSTFSSIFYWKMNW